MSWKSFFLISLISLNLGNTIPLWAEDPDGLDYAEFPEEWELPEAYPYAFEPNWKPIIRVHIDGETHFGRIAPRLAKVVPSVGLVPLLASDELNLFWGPKDDSQPWIIIDPEIVEQAHESVRSIGYGRTLLRRPVPPADFQMSELHVDLVRTVYPDGTPSISIANVRAVYTFTRGGEAQKREEYLVRDPFLLHLDLESTAGQNVVMMVPQSNYYAAENKPAPEGITGLALWNPPQTRVLAVRVFDYDDDGVTFAILEEYRAFLRSARFPVRSPSLTLYRLPRNAFRQARNSGEMEAGLSQFNNEFQTVLEEFIVTQVPLRNLARLIWNRSSTMDAGLSRQIRERLPENCQTVLEGAMAERDIDPPTDPSLPTPEDFSREAI